MLPLIHVKGNRVLFIINLKWNLVCYSNNRFSNKILRYTIIQMKFYIGINIILIGINSYFYIVNNVLVLINDKFYILIICNFWNIVEFNLDCQQYQHESMRKIKHGHSNFKQYQNLYN